MVPGQAASWPQAEVTSHIATSLEALLVAKGQHEGRGGDVANTVDLQEGLCLRILPVSF